MKINWGTGIVIAFALYISFILFFVIKARAPENRYYFDEDNYYKASLVYEENVMDKLENTKTLSNKVVITKTDNGYILEFPKEINENTTGTVSFYRPSTNLLDFELPIAIKNNKMFVTHKNLVAGRWNITIAFTSNNEKYLVKRSLNY